VVLILRPMIFDDHVPSFDVTGLLQSLKKRGLKRVVVMRRVTEIADYRRRRLLRTRRERQRSRRTEKRDELAPVAVGTLIAERPPHRSVRAAFPHTVPTLGIHGNYMLPYASQHL